MKIRTALGRCCCGSSNKPCCCSNLDIGDTVVIDVSGFDSSCNPERNGKFYFTRRDLVAGGACQFDNVGLWKLTIEPDGENCKFLLIDKSGADYSFELTTDTDCCPAAASAMSYTGSNDSCATSPAAELLCSEVVTSTGCDCSSAPSHVLIEFEGIVPDACCNCCWNLNRGFVCPSEFVQDGFGFPKCSWYQEISCGDLDPWGCCDDPGSYLKVSATYGNDGFGVYRVTASVLFFSAVHTATVMQNSFQGASRGTPYDCTQFNRERCDWSSSTVVSPLYCAKAGRAFVTAL